MGSTANDLSTTNDVSAAADVSSIHDCHASDAHVLSSFYSQLCYQACSEARRQEACRQEACIQEACRQEDCREGWQEGKEGWLLWLSTEMMSAVLMPLEISYTGIALRHG